MDNHQNNEVTGLFCECISLLTKQHEPTHTVFILIRQKFLLFVKYLNELSKGEGMVAQTGSSFDDLHLSRIFQDSHGCHKFYPPIDFDFMMTYVNYVIQDKTDKPKNENDFNDLRKSVQTFGIMIAGANPGYVKILITNFGRAILESKKEKCDFNQHITVEGFLPNNIFRMKVIPEQMEDEEILYKRQKSTYTVSGPALSDLEHEPEGYTYDFVHAFPCPSWPSIALNWIKRHKPGEWPNQELIEDIVQDGCAVVPVGHHLSEEANLEWRVSFNSAERKLSASLLPCQKSCYSILKLLLKAGLSTTSILTSYHVKNMMFWFCEQMYGPADWSENTIGERMIELLDYIIKALDHHSIPNYFVPPNNLISHRENGAIDATKKEISIIKENIFQTISLVCSKLKLFEEMSGISNKTELHQMLTIYTAFVQTLYKVGILNLSTAIDIECFQKIVALNKCMKPYIKTASATFSAVSIPELLKPLATLHMQTGDADKALRLNQIMIEDDFKLVKDYYPEVFSNIACLFGYKYQTCTEAESKKLYFDEAMANFEIANSLITNSPSLHFSFGNFLFTSKSSLKEVISHLEKATTISQPRPDDEVLMQIDICESGTQSKSQNMYVDGRIAALYLLTCIYIDTCDIYKARKCTQRIQKYVDTAILTQKWSAHQILAVSFRKNGLCEKADITFSDAKKFMPFKT
ncbi:unnamed protein product [Mytilus coruscus]|uniref:Uncharacterized protein n=1 Tax=Mytilus coruscus TaxID=42192 RepID=A0A6J8DWR4_MYTCO|nr:unnamed protein product [Mytilus coruscus]